jgi:hypothetical protein
MADTYRTARLPIRLRGFISPDTSSHAPTDKVLILESNTAYGLDGVGYRSIGMLRDKGLKPPVQWWNLPDVWTWRRVCSTYLFRQQAWLKVKDRKLSGLENTPS